MTSPVFQSLRKHYWSQLRFACCATRYGYGDDVSSGLGAAETICDVMQDLGIDLHQRYYERVIRLRGKLSSLQ